MTKKRFCKQKSHLQIFANFSYLNESEKEKKSGDMF